MVNMENKRTIRELQHFIGKPCSFFTNQHQRNLKDEQQIVYFIGFPTEINEDGVFYKSYKGDKLNFININHLVSICEEELVTQPQQKAPDNLSDLEKMMSKKSS